MHLNTPEYQQSRPSSARSAYLLFHDTISIWLGHRSTINQGVIGGTGDRRSANTLSARSFYILLGLALNGAAQASPPKRSVAPGAHAATAKKPVLKVFAFKEVVAGELIDASWHGSCTDARPEEQGCRQFYENSVAGVSLPRGIFYTLYKRRLSAMRFTFANQGGQFDMLASAFTEKYGAPCGESADKWQSEAGAVFDNATMIWCFSSGKLTLQERSGERDIGIAHYQDDNQVPAKIVPKDF